MSRTIKKLKRENTSADPICVILPIYKTHESDVIDNYLGKLWSNFTKKPDYYVNGANLSNIFYNIIAKSMYADAWQTALDTINNPAHFSDLDLKNADCTLKQKDKLVKKEIQRILSHAFINSSPCKYFRFVTYAGHLIFFRHFIGIDAPLLDATFVQNIKPKDLKKADRDRFYQKIIEKNVPVLYPIV